MPRQKNVNLKITMEQAVTLKIMLDSIEIDLEDGSNDLKMESVRDSLKKQLREQIPREVFGLTASE